VSFTTAQINALTLEGVTTEVIRRALERLAREPAVAAAGADAGRRIGPRATALLHHFEGCKLTAYKCPAGVWTIGWGNTFYEDGVPVAPGDTITQARADELFRLIVVKFEAAVEKAAPSAPAHQFGAMVCLSYNIGVDAFGRSTVLRRHLAGDHAGAAEAFLMWNKSSGRVLRGLTRRRQAERLLYLNQLPDLDRAIGYRP